MGGIQNLRSFNIQLCRIFYFHGLPRLFMAAYFFPTECDTLEWDLCTQEDAKNGVWKM